MRIVAPQNSRDNQLVDLARVNAKEEARRQHNLDMETLLNALGKALSLFPTSPAHRMCRCIAYWGKQTRVGLVVYIDGLPSKEDYRVYSRRTAATITRLCMPGWNAG